MLPDVTEAEIEAFLLERLDSVRSGQANTGQANTAPVPNADKSGCTACAWGPVNVPYMPAMPPSRFPVIGQQKLVELLREKEERKGFNPRPVTVRRYTCIRNPLTAGAAFIRFLHFLLAHYIPPFKHGKDKM